MKITARDEFKKTFSLDITDSEVQALKEKLDPDEGIADEAYIYRETEENGGGLQIFIDLQPAMAALNRFRGVSVMLFTVDYDQITRSESKAKK